MTELPTLDFSSLAIGGVALIPLIVGLIEFSKSLGIKGAWLKAEAFALGVAFISAWAMIEIGLMPAVAGPWVTVAVIGLGGGVVAALASMGGYDLIKRLFGSKSVELSVGGINFPVRHSQRLRRDPGVHSTARHCAHDHYSHSQQLDPLPLQYYTNEDEPRPPHDHSSHLNEDEPRLSHDHTGEDVSGPPHDHSVHFTG